MFAEEYIYGIAKTYKDIGNSVLWFKRSSVYNQYVVKMLSSIGPKFPEKLGNCNFLVICMSTHCPRYKVLQNSVLQFKRSSYDKNTSQHCLPPSPLSLSTIYYYIIHTFII